MILHRVLSDSKSPQAFRTLLNILADLNNAVVWMVSTRPLITMSSSLCTFDDCTKRTTYNWYHRHFLVFSVLKQGLGTYLCFRFLSVLLCCQPEWQSPLFDKFDWEKRHSFIFKTCLTNELLFCLNPNVLNQSKLFKTNRQAKRLRFHMIAEVNPP